MESYDTIIRRLHSQNAALKKRVEELEAIVKNLRELTCHDCAKSVKKDDGFYCPVHNITTGQPWCEQWEEGEAT